MKSEIKYNADTELLNIIKKWQIWLKEERRYSLHTLDGYCRDLSDFFNFFDNQISLKTLMRFDVRDFRLYISSCASRGLDKTSIARHI